MLTPEQIAERKNFIGGSEIAAIMGLSRWGSPLSIWAEKTGKVPQKDLSGVEIVQMGNELEDFIAQKFSKETGFKVRRAANTYYHDKYPYLAANIDRLIEGTDYILECKNVSAWKAKEWDGEEIPREYILQVMWYLGITGRTKGYIACLIGGNTFKYKEIDFDKEIFEDMVAQAVAFWEGYVKGDVMPMALSQDTDFIKEFFKTQTDDEIETLDTMYNCDIGILQETKKKIAALEKEKEEIENRIKQKIGEHEGAMTENYIITWKQVHTEKVDTAKLREDGLYGQYIKPSSFRKLTIKEKK